MVSAALPVLTWIATLVALRRRAEPAGRLEDLVRATLLTSVVWGIYLLLVTEVASLMTALSFWPLVVAWALPIPFLLATPGAARAEETGSAPHRLEGLQISALTAIAGLAGLTGLVALISAPNTWDSMTYHLPRVMHWEQNRSVAHFATHELRQLYQSPWAEMVATHLQILSGGDRFANLVQWSSFLGSLLAVAAIAGQLGAGPTGRILSMLAAATIPMGLLQAVSTQTDLAVAFHVLCAVFFLLEAERTAAWPSLLAAAGATGLAFLTKATAYLFLAPFLVAFAWRLLGALRAAAYSRLTVFGALVLLLNLGHYSRNVRLFGAPLQPPAVNEYHRYANQAHSPTALLSNLLRNAALHLTLPAPAVVAFSFEGIRDLHQQIGIDPEDSRITWPGQKFAPAPVLIHEDFSGNFAHFVIVIAALAGLSASRRWRRAHPALVRHAALVVGGCLLFASYLKWTPWHARLHLSLFLLWAPVLGLFLERLPRLLAAVLAAGLVAQALPFAISNPLHPLRGESSILSTSRSEQTFYPRPLLGEFYRRTASAVAAAGCDRVGFSMSADAWEYPLWVALRRASDKRPRCASLEPAALTRELLDPGFEPCAVICLNCSAARGQRYSALFGEPVLTAEDDLAHTDDNLLFLE